MKEKFIPFYYEQFKYTGVWQSDAADMIESYHTSAQVEFGFTGNTLKIKAETVKNEYIIFMLDEKEVLPQENNDGLLTFLTTDSAHRFKIIMTRHSKLKFFGVYISESGEIFRTKDNMYIQFIGDSITDAYPGYATTVANNLSVDYSIVSLCGMSLVDKWGWYKLIDGASERIGMESNYFCLQNPQEVVTPLSYDFKKCRVPDAFVIYLGTNDYISQKEHKDAGNSKIFAERYFNFIGKIEARFGEKPIFILQNHRKDTIRTEAINMAYNKIKSKYKHIYLIDCYNWDVELVSDGVHPSQNGYKTMAEHITELIKENIKGLNE
ncbi:MAG: hypothetical protein E7562_02040 [Ruminococcaceae bacterium]|nr:hypothetical protein [Oscillospiraceae bacterium]